MAACVRSPRPRSHRGLREQFRDHRRPDTALEDPSAWRYDPARRDGADLDQWRLPAPSRRDPSDHALHGVGNRHVLDRPGGCGEQYLRERRRQRQPDQHCDGRHASDIPARRRRVRRCDRDLTGASYSGLPRNAGVGSRPGRDLTLHATLEGPLLARVRPPLRVQYSTHCDLHRRWFGPHCKCLMLKERHI